MGDRYLPEIFRMTAENNSLFKVPDHPSDKITVKILLEKSNSLDLKDLNRRFLTDGMKASRDDKNKNAIVVRGIPPYDGFGAHNILTVVQNFDAGARIIR